MNFVKKRLINNQSMIDIAMQEYGCYEGLALILQDNLSIIAAVGQLLPAGTILNIRAVVPILTEDNRLVAANYLNQSTEVANGGFRDQEDYPAFLLVDGNFITFNNSFITLNL